jgi:alcohol-forming fatty acyl-CoA reductase
VLQVQQRVELKMDESRMDSIFEDNFLTSTDMLENADSHSPIKDFLKDKTIFLTGGFGFIGKLLIEKLLICEVKKIYLLVRAKKGKSLPERFEKLINEPVSEITL